jgi:hypothetical protein
MTEASVSFAGNLTDDPEVRYTEGGIARLGVRSEYTWACRQPRYAKSESKPEWQCRFIPESITAIASASIYRIALGLPYRTTSTDKGGACRRLEAFSPYCGYSKLP